MSNIQTPYACAICKKEFRSAVFLVKHVEWRHSKSKQSSKLSKTDIKTTKSYSSGNNETHSSNSKDENKCIVNQPFVIKIEENEKNDEEHDNSQYSPNFLDINFIETEKSYSFFDNQGQTSNSKSEIKTKSNEPFVIKIEDKEIEDEDNHIPQDLPNIKEMNSIENSTVLQNNCEISNSLCITGKGTKTNHDKINHQSSSKKNCASVCGINYLSQT